jgi:hypothetical protein
MLISRTFRCPGTSFDNIDEAVFGINTSFYSYTAANLHFERREKFSNTQIRDRFLYLEEALPIDILHPNTTNFNHELSEFLNFNNTGYSQFWTED